jgi:hypothetical protein
MLTTTSISETRSEKGGSCDVKIWSGDCEHSTYATMGDKYRCDACKTIPGLDHEVRPATMPYVSGDYTNLS